MCQKGIYRKKVNKAIDKFNGKGRSLLACLFADDTVSIAE